MDAVGLETAGPVTSVGLVVARFANYAALTAVVGLLLVPLLQAGAVPARGLRPAVVGRWAAAAALLTSLAAIALFVFSLSNAVARPLPDVLSADLVERYVRTRFGSTVAVQAAFMLVVAGLAAVVQDARTSAVALLTAWAAGLAPAWWGHAASADVVWVAVFSHWLHLLGATAWAGGLAGLVLVARREPDAVVKPAWRFSRLAGWAFAGVALTGVVNTALHVDDVAQLGSTTWGRLAVAKAVLLVVLGIFGWWHRKRSLPLLRAGETRRATFQRLAGVELVVMAGAFALATTMASGMPADVEAALAVQSPTVALHDGTVNLTLDPARRGQNEVHLYVFGPAGGPREVDDASVQLEGPASVEPELFVAGVGHYFAPSVEVPAAGQYEARISVVIDGQPHEARASLTVR